MLVGKRIALRVATKADAELLLGWYNDPAYWGDNYNIWPTSLESVHERIEKWRTSEGGLYIITDRATGEPMGTGGYYSPHAASYRTVFPDFEVWYHIHPNYRRQRVATQAACLLIDHLFGSMPLERLTGFVTAGNAGSARVLELAGMQREGVWRRMMFLHGEWVDVLLYGILRAEWGDHAHYAAEHDF
jgi:RimJ/RimL family protein N-acetyltransferase